MNTKNSSTLTKKYRMVLSAVHMVYRLVNSTYNVNELILRLTRLLCQFIKARSASIYILDSRNKKIILIGSYDNKINMLITKKKDLVAIPDEEKRVTKGYAILDPYLIGLPLIADDNIGAIFIRRNKDSGDQEFNSFDRDMLSVVTEQSVTAIKNLQLYEQQQKITLGSIEFIGQLLKKYGHSSDGRHTPLYFKIVKSLAEKLHVNEKWIDCLYYASILHDAGAIDVPYEILFKTSRLTAEEFRIIRQQPAKSVELIKPVEFLKPVLPIILYRHEKYDGSGYPSGLKKEQIPLGARIMTVVDAFEAMTHERAYKSRLSIDDAIEEIRVNGGTQFDPKVVKAFVELSRQKKFRNYLRSARG